VCMRPKSEGKSELSADVTERLLDNVISENS